MASSDRGRMYYRGEGDDTEGPDFSYLPCVVWVKVLQLLDVTDLYHATLTCSRLHALFDVPSLWSHAELHLSVNRDGTLRKYSNLSVLRYKHSVLQYVVVHVHIKCFNLLQVMSAEEISTLVELPLSKNLKSLKIVLHMDIDSFKNVIAINNTAHMPTVLDKFCDELCDNAPEKLNVELVLTVMDKCFSNSSACELFCSLWPRMWYQPVTSLSFPHGSRSEESQFSLYPQLGFTPTAELVSMFPSLRSLSLNAVNLSDELLYQLVDTSHSHCALTSFAIHFRACDLPWYFLEEATAKLPELSSSAWRELVSACSNLEVSCFLGEDMTLKGLCSVVSPDVPVVSVQYLYDHNKGIEACVQFCLQHSETLQRFTYRQSYISSNARCQWTSDLTSMVKACPRLRHLEYKGEIHHTDVIKLAEIKRQWTTFVFYDNFMILLDARDKLDSPGCKGDPSPRCQGDTKETLSKVCERVSWHLGYPWKPRHINTF